MRPSFTDRRVVLLLLALAAIVVSSCSRGGRCGECGMRLDPKSPWRAELTSASGAVAQFDTPRCALRAHRRAPSRLRVIEYYSGEWRDATSVRFVEGSDVVGPMGAELVPVDPLRAESFARDHHATSVRRLEELEALPALP